MKFLAIETSCDETAVSIVEARGDFPHASYTVLGNALFSQVDIHREYGGVFPAVAKREHAKTLVPMLERALSEAAMLKSTVTTLSPKHTMVLENILTREPGLAETLLGFLESKERPDIDLIAVTSGPGLEPALWVGVNFARALSTAWDIPIVSVNHMEGHVLSSIFDGTIIPELQFPSLALLISGGHTEMVLMQDWVTYELVGETRDDAVGEAFDKVARMLDLPYPGGPEISKLAENARNAELPTYAHLPRPMLDSGDYDFSFSGLKTAVKYAIKDRSLTGTDRAALARDFEDAVADVLIKKAHKAVDAYGAQNLILGGGVSANTHIRRAFASFFRAHHPMLTLYLPDQKLTTDNSVMIALAGHARTNEALIPAATGTIRAEGNKQLTTTRR